MKIAIVMMALLAGAPPADDGAQELIRKGRHAFNLKQYDVAIGHLQKAYEISTKADVLYMLAQVYRQKGSCDEALHFYKRYKSDCRDDCKLNTRTDDLIKETAAQCETKRAMVMAPPPGLLPDENPPVGPKASRDGEKPSEVDAVATSETTPPPKEPARLLTPLGLSPQKPSPWFVRAEAGLVWLQLDGVSSGQTGLRAAAGYQFEFGPFRMGPALSVSMLPWSYRFEDTEGTSLFTEIAAAGVASYAVASRVDVRGEATAGVLLIGAPEAGVPLRSDRTASASAVALLGAALGVDVRVIGPLHLGVTGSIKGTPSRGALAASLLVIGAQVGATLRW